MKNKKIDNQILEKKRILNEMDDKIDLEKKKLKQMEGIWEELISLNKNLDKCIDILSRSMQGPNLGLVYDDMRDSNKRFLVKTSGSLEEYTEILKKNIDDLSAKREEIVHQKTSEENKNNQKNKSI